MKPDKLYTVQSVQGRVWVIVTQQPVPRAEAIKAVAEQWALDRKARAIPHTS